MTDIYLPLFGQLAWIDAILLVWFTLTATVLCWATVCMTTRQGCGVTVRDHGPWSCWVTPAAKAG